MRGQAGVGVVGIKGMRAILPNIGVRKAFALKLRFELARSNLIGAPVAIISRKRAFKSLGRPGEILFAERHVQHSLNWQNIDREPANPEGHAKQQILTSTNVE